MSVSGKCFLSAGNMDLMNLSRIEVLSIADTAITLIKPKKSRTFRSLTCVEIGRTPTKLIACSEADISRTFVNWRIF